MKERVATLLLSFLVTLIAASCTQREPVPPQQTRPQRIISVVPSATETLFALGVADRVIAVSDYDHIPEEFGDRPRIGGLLNPNIEKILEFKPDLVVTYGSQQVLQERLKTIGIRLYPFVHGGVEDTLRFMLDLGATVGAEEQSRAIVERIRQTFAEIRAERPDEAHPKVMIVQYRTAGALGSFYSVGSHAFQNELIEIAGGRNVFADVDKEVLQPTIEEVLARAPDIIIETLPSPLRAEEADQRLADWRTLRSLPAVANKRVHILAENFLLLPGPQLDLAARRLADIVHR